MCQEEKKGINRNQPLYTCHKKKLCENFGK